MKEEKKEEKKEPPKPVSIFTDMALQEAVRSEVFEKRYNKEPITKEDVANISRVVGKGKGIKNLEGLQHCKALMLIDLEDNQIDDLTPIAELKRLQSVTLANNKIKDIKPLENLTAMQLLDLSGNEVSDLAALKKMSNLRTLYVAENQLKSLEPIAGLIEDLVAGRIEEPTHRPRASRKAGMVDDAGYCWQPSGIARTADHAARVGHVVDVQKQSRGSYAIGRHVSQRRRRGTTLRPLHGSLPRRKSDRRKEEDRANKTARVIRGRCLRQVEELRVVVTRFNRVFWDNRMNAVTTNK